MTDTIMLEAPARGGRISDLADGQGRILRLHDLTASSLGHTSHANQTESPTRTGGRVTIERKPDEGDGPAVIHRLNDERDQRWRNLIVAFSFMRAAASFVTMGNTSTQPCRMAPGGHRRRTHHH